MKKVSASVFSLALMAGLGVANTSFAVVTTAVTETHRQGEIHLMVKNLSHSVIKVHFTFKSEHKYGPTLYGSTFMKRLKFDDKAAWVVGYDIPNSTVIDKHFGSKINIKKLYKVVDGRHYYKRCTVGVFGGPGKPSYKMWGPLCHNVDVKATVHSGSTSYVHVNYDPMHTKDFH